MRSPELVLPRIDKPRQIDLENTQFYQPHKAELRTLFHALGREKYWSDNPRELMKYIGPAWIGNEHGNYAGKDQFTPQQITDAWKIFEKMGFCEELVPPANTHYDDTIIVGGTMVANYHRMNFTLDLLYNHGITTDTITFWGGQRPRDKRDGTDEELLSPVGRFAGNDISHNSWIQHELQKKKRGEEMFATETDMARIALLKTLPDGAELKPHRIDVELLNNNTHTADVLHIEKVEPRLLTDYHFEIPIVTSTHEKKQHIILMHGASVQRERGNPRHSTTSCTKEWLLRHPPRQDARILYISGNPHTIRTAQDTQRILTHANRTDITLDVAGTGINPTPTSSPHAVLGEIGRLIHLDVKKNY